VSQGKERAKQALAPDAKGKGLTHGGNGGDEVDELRASKSEPSSLRRLWLDLLVVVGLANGFSFGHVDREGRGCRVEVVL
jgi:hypothetical protein